MEHYAAIDVSLEWSSVCIVDVSGRIVREARVRSERKALAGFFPRQRLEICTHRPRGGALVTVAARWAGRGRVAGDLYRDPPRQGALKAMTVKTDKNDARGMAQLMRLVGSGPSMSRRPLSRRSEPC